MRGACITSLPCLTRLCDAPPWSYVSRKCRLEGRHILRTGKSEKITIKNDKGRLSEEDIERMVKEAEDFAEQARFKS